MFALNRLKRINLPKLNVSLPQTYAKTKTVNLGLKAIMTFVDPDDPFVTMKLDAKKHPSNRHGLP